MSFLVHHQRWKILTEPIGILSYEDYATSKVYRFLTNNMEYEALTISELYRERWNVELYFKWIKQHLHIKSFYGTSENAIYLPECCICTDSKLVLILINLVKSEHYFFNLSK